MHHRARSIRPSLLALGFGLLAAGPIQSQSGPAGTLAGLWKLNVELSDRIEEKFREAMRVGVFYGGVRKGPQNGRPGVRHEDDLAAERELAAMIVPVLQLQIRQDDATVTISDAGGQMQPLATDGRKVKETLLSGAELETQARWKDGRLTIERKQNKVGSVREVYFVDVASRKLILEIRLSSKSLPRALEFRRVYDPATGS